VHVVLAADLGRLLVFDLGFAEPAEEFGDHGELQSGLVLAEYL
jgi:hypothetical protein